MTDIAGLTTDDDVTFARRLIHDPGVAAVPGLVVLLATGAGPDEAPVRVPEAARDAPGGVGAAGEAGDPGLTRLARATPRHAPRQSRARAAPPGFPWSGNGRVLARGASQLPHGSRAALPGRARDSRKTGNPGGRVGGSRSAGSPEAGRAQAASAARATTPVRIATDTLPSVPEQVVLGEVAVVEQAEPGDRLGGDHEADRGLGADQHERHDQEPLEDADRRPDLGRRARRDRSGGASAAGSAGSAGSLLARPGLERADPDDQPRAAGRRARRAIGVGRGRRRRRSRRRRAGSSQPISVPQLDRADERRDEQRAGPDVRDQRASAMTTRPQDDVVDGRRGRGRRAGCRSPSTTASVGGWPASQIAQATTVTARWASWSAAK